MKTLRFLLPAAVLALAACGPSGPQRLTIGSQLPEFELESLAGGEVASSSLAGKTVVVNFWATWCQPCVVEHPVLVDGARRYDGRATFLGVIYQDEPEKIQRFIDRAGDWGPTLVDPESKVAIGYGVYGAPETFFIDPEGIIVEKVTGAMSPTFLSRRIESLLPGSRG